MDIILTVGLAIATYGFGFFTGVINTTETKEIQENNKPINEDRKEAFEFAIQMEKTTKFKVTIILDVAEQEIEDMQYNAENYIKEDIEDKCLYIDNIEIITN